MEILYMLYFILFLMNANPPSFMAKFGWNFHFFCSLTFARVMSLQTKLIVFQLYEHISSIVCKQISMKLWQCHDYKWEIFMKQEVSVSFIITRLDSQLCLQDLSVWSSLKCVVQERVNPFPNKPLFLCVCLLGAISPFSKCFLSFWRTLCHIHQT